MKQIRHSMEMKAKIIRRMPQMPRFNGTYDCVEHKLLSMILHWKCEHDMFFFLCWMPCESEEIIKKSSLNYSKV